jgi:hypothetical protein
LILGVIGVALTLAWWSFRGEHKSVPTSDRIPPVVFGGGGGPVTVSFDVSGPAVLRASFGHGKNGKGGHDQRLDAYPKFPAGHHEVTFEAAPETWSSLELELERPSPGATLSWSVTAGGREVHRHSEALSGALAANEAFFDNVEFADVSAGTLEGR